VKKAAVVIFVIALLVAGFFYARRTSPFFNFVFPPQDMFQPLARKQVDMALAATKLQLEFKPEYPGNHELVLEVEKLDPGVQLKGKLVLAVLLKNNRGERINTKGRRYGSFWSATSKGFPLKSFDAPSDIGIGETGTVEVTISSPDPEFSKTYGTAHLVVQKGSDE
jgi:hypothetical protein